MTRTFAVPAAESHTAVAHLLTRLQVETDVADVHADLTAGVPDLVVVDSRGDVAWEQGHLPGAVHLPTAQIAERAAATVPPGARVVTYCWGPGCDGATRAALEFARLGYPVKEMRGGYEYWVREGLAVVTTTGSIRRPVDDLTAPRPAVGCDC
ncbi:Rhodanese-related sulfurtransferase [Micromonospora phaseoli]|uniref:Rhodanese-related sulfurtransferase n=1 Tax=Micromonospora phaseoli TaxID=1144548 RepID=A0A1H6RHD2_9ACTN|nr:rhodanese-like domain-containing protein [Micromonospora phaseoli]PZW03308.1 rhodanese-related sulfurtransferase [Micromonospora phaseoli]GIJ78358.1 sulfurtransferase [Micromonospora phaseoli]SEI50995.1 Rhodanese-related sulfurtransferase [Micromonospora phaseoli]